MSYDASNEVREFVADSRDEAVSKACEFFGIEEEALAVAELQPGDAYGMSTRSVLVAYPRDRVAPPRRDERDEPRRGGGDRDRGGRDRGGRGDRGGRDRDRGGPGDRGGRDRDRGGPGDRGDRGGRGGREERGEGRDRGGRDRDRDKDRDRDDRAAAPPPEPVGPSEGEVVGEIGEVTEFVQGIIERMELGPFKISESTDGDLMVIQVSGPAAQTLTSGDGRTVDAVQLVTNQAALRLDDEAPRVVLDVEGDPDARDDRLTKLAQRAARRARDTGRSVALDAMNGKDRRAIHLALRDEEDVATMSMGEGRYRQVVVVPEGAAEFEEAQRESEAAADRSTD